MPLFRELGKLQLQTIFYNTINNSNIECVQKCALFFLKHELFPKSDKFSFSKSLGVIPSQEIGRSQIRKGQDEF